MKRIVTTFLFVLVLLTSLPIPLIPINKAVFAIEPGYELDFPIPHSRAHIYVYYTEKWPMLDRSAMNDYLNTYLPLFCNKFFTPQHDATITVIFQNDSNTFHAWGEIIRDTQSNIIGYNGTFESGPLYLMEQLVVGRLSTVLHELTHVFQFMIPSYVSILGQHVEAQAEAIPHIFISETQGIESQNITVMRWDYGGELVNPDYYGQSAYSWAYVPGGTRGGYHLYKSWEKLYIYDNEVFIKLNNFITRINSSINGNIVKLRDALLFSVFHTQTDYAFDGYSLNEWLNGFSFYDSPNDIVKDSKMMHWYGFNWFFNSSSGFYFRGIPVAKNGNVFSLPAHSTFDATIRDGHSGEILHSIINDTNSQISVGDTRGNLLICDLLKIEIVAHYDGDEDLSLTAYLAGEPNDVFTTMENRTPNNRVIFFLNRQGFSEGNGTSNVGRVIDGILKWKIEEAVEAVIEWSEGTYTYDINNIISSPLIAMTQIGIRLYESKVFLTPHYQECNVDDSIQFSVKVSPKISTGKIQLYRSADKLNWIQIAESTPSNGAAEFNVSVSEASQNYFFSSWTGDNIIDPSNSSIVQVKITGIDPTPSTGPIESTSEPTPEPTSEPTSEPTPEPKPDGVTEKDSLLPFNLSTEMVLVIGVIVAIVIVAIVTYNLRKKKNESEFGSDDSQKL